MGGPTVVTVPLCRQIRNPNCASTAVNLLEAIAAVFREHRHRLRSVEYQLCQRMEGKGENNRGQNDVIRSINQ